MASKNLKIDHLKLDLLNPRIGKVGDQHAAMQAMSDEQGVKLANLAESIVDAGGLNPMDVLLVLKDQDDRYIVLEGVVAPKSPDISHGAAWAAMNSRGERYPSDLCG